MPEVMRERCSAMRVHRAYAWVRKLHPCSCGYCLVELIVLSHAAAAPRPAGLHELARKWPAVPTACSSTH